jgi:hypothetical protein
VLAEEEPARPEDELLADAEDEALDGPGCVTTFAFFSGR